ncbi:stage III sporulation protein SpoIIIAB [Ruminiclostridium cellobioparum]|jgi:stage III sporulation protein AB|uniref:stage III sporulation protein SpoIIIAB n=1 Tax=Ruminiclostridium cellobioparum TaxID=29355 RepID=UPI0004846763|nr:stage III sporulation protein SpoIIIAB [Ruminiclostridium cellobioparum]
MLLKMIGAVVLTGATSLIGFLLAADCSKRPRTLRELQALLQMLENEISYLSNLLTEAFFRIYETSKVDAAILFKAAALNLQTGGVTADMAWDKAVNEYYSKLSLNREDRAILITFGKMLGNSDLEGQLNNIRLVSSQLKLQEAKSEEMKRKNEKMYRTLGVLSGLALAIILF